MLLQAKELTKHYPGQNGAPVEALRSVNLEMAPGDFAAVQGSSGCGKSTLLLTVGALLQPTNGQVKIDGADPYGLSPEERAKFRAKNIGFVFQQFHLVPYLSVRDNILVPTLTSESDAGPERADALLDQLQLTHRANHPPAQLSTGERQRTALARALLNKPQLLLADEPTGNLDRKNADIVLGHLRRFADDGGAVLLVTHDPHAANKASRAIQIEDGRLVES